MYQLSLGFLAAMLNGVKQCGIQRGGPASWHHAGHSSCTHSLSLAGFERLENRVLFLG